jgi:hypothetical protein
MSSIEAMRLHAVLITYTRGFALMQMGVEAEQSGTTAEQALDATVAQLDPANFPTLRGVSDPGQLVAASDDSFEEGLRLLVAGIKADLERPQLTASQRRRPRSGRTGERR